MSHPCVSSDAEEYPLGPGSTLKGISDEDGRAGEYWHAGLYEMYATKSIRNERLALTRRLLREPTYRCDITRLQEGREFLGRRKRGLTPLTTQELLDKYGGMKLARYQQAVSELEAYGLHVEDFKISSFVKKERVNDRTTYPRMVHHRDYKAIFEVLRYVKVFEKKFYQFEHNINGFMTEGRVVAKGLNGNQRHDLIKRKFDRFSHCQVLSLDCSSFELHVSIEIMEAYFSYVSGFYPSDSYLKWMFSHMIHHFGRTMMGQKWSRTDGGLISGDAITSSLATYLMVLACVQYSIETGIEIDFLSDGDDTLMFFEEGSVDFTHLQAFFADIGFLLRLDGVTTVFEEIIFCQHRFVDGCMIRNPEEIISKALTICSNSFYDDPEAYISSLGKCLKSVYGVIPEMVPIFDTLITVDREIELGDYWLKMPQEKSIAEGAIFDYFEFDLELLQSLADQASQFSPSSVSRMGW